jgi:hypothetical protein
LKGDHVIVRAFGNEPLVRIVWESDRDVVWICTEENYSHLIADLPALRPVGFLAQNVYEYDATMLATLKRRYKEDQDVWNRFDARRYDEQKRQAA